MCHFRSPQVEKIMLFDHFAQRPNKNKCMIALSDLRLREHLFILVQLPGPSHNDHAANLTMHVVPSSQSAISFVKPPDHGAASHETVNRQSGGQFFVHCIRSEVVLVLGLPVLPFSNSVWKV